MTATTIHRVPLPDNIHRNLERVQKAAIRNKTERDALIVEAYQQGASMREIANAVGMTHPGVRNILISKGVHNPRRIEPDDET